jgi:Mg-chelatase subunit ChlD
MPKIETTLMVFVVDTSMPGGGKRIAAVKGAIATLLPKTKVSVVSCFGDEAEMTLEPTSSFITTCRKLMTMKGSVMGNLGAGLDVALKTSEKALKNNVADRVVMVVVADGKAHGLLTGTSDCEVAAAEVCDLELMTSAVAVQIKAKELEMSGMKLKSVIVDTEAGRMVNGAEWSEEGARLASVTGADYYHLPELMDTDLVRLAFICLKYIETAA